MTNRTLKVGLAALLAGASIVAVASDASAAGFGHGGYSGGGHAAYNGGGRGYGGGYGYRGSGYGYRGGYGWGWGAGGLAAGLVLGSALAGPYYNGGYYGAACVAPEQVWSPYYGRYVVQQVQVPC
jgi:hypothetical protein